MAQRELAIWASALLLANNVVAELSAPHEGSYGWYWIEQSKFGGFDALAWGVALWRLVKTSSRPATAREVALVLALCLLGGLRQPETAPLALTGIGLWLLATGDVEARATAAVFLAIASHQIWGRVVFNFVSPEMVKLDAAMVGAAMSLIVKGANWHDNIVTVPSGFSIAVFEGCSSFTNVSASLLAWVALAKLERPRWVRNDAWVAAAAILAQVGLNVGRLCLIAPSQAMYLYWHDGDGAQIYVATASATAVFIGAFGTRWAAGEK